MTRIKHHFLSFYNDRPQNAKIKALVLHCSAYHSKEMIDILSQERLSAHYIVDTDGTITQLVAEEKRAWHAGVSKWRQMENLNNYSIGIELTSLSMGQENYPQAQLKAAINLCRQIIRHYQIPLYNVVAHSDIAPSRKPDPGVAFPWKKLAAKKIGLWYCLDDAAKVKETDVGRLLQQIGYDISNLNAAAYAFCRHFIPETVQIVSDKDLLQQEVFPADFVFPLQYLPILQACAYRYSLK